MADSPDAIRTVAPGKWDTRRGVLPGAWLQRRGWKTVDPLYVWSAAAGLFVALVLLAVALVMQTGRVH